MSDYATELLRRQLQGESFPSVPRSRSLSYPPRLTVRLNCTHGALSHGHVNEKGPRDQVHPRVILTSTLKLTPTLFRTCRIRFA